MFRGAVSGRSRAKGAGDGERGMLRGPLGRAGVVMNVWATLMSRGKSEEGGGREEGEASDGRDNIKVGCNRGGGLLLIVERSKRCDSVPLPHPLSPPILSPFLYKTTYILHASSTTLSTPKNLSDTLPAWLFLEIPLVLRMCLTHIL